MKGKEVVRGTLRRWRVTGLIGVALLIALLATPLAGAAPGAQGGGVLRIGYLGMAGTDTANGAQLAISQINSIGGINAAGGPYQVELVTLSVPPTIDTLPGALAELIAQDVIAILGPDTNALITPDTIQALASARRPVLTAATGDALTDVDKDDYIFRIRAPERVFSFAVATYLTEDLGLTSIAVVQTEVEFTEALLNFESALNNAGLQVADRVQLPGGDTLVQQAPGLIGLNPQAIVLWSAPEDATALLRALRAGGWTGVYVYRQADEAARAGILPDDLANGVLGMDSWSYAAESSASRIFRRDYVVAFGEVPGPLAVAAYDAIWFLRGVILTEGIDPAAIRAGLLGSGPQNLVQGVLHPLEFVSGDLSRNGVVYALGPRGGPRVLAQFDDTRRLPEGETPGPVATLPPAETPLPTATLEGTWVRVNVETLNVRNGPGFNYDKIGEVGLDETYRVLGAIADYSWVAIDFSGGVGWVKTEFVEILGDLGAVSIIQAPPSPTPGATAVPTLPPNPDIVIQSVALNPPEPIPGVPFTATITVANAGGGAAGRFAVAATWEPDKHYTATFVEGLAGGQSVQVQLTDTLTMTGSQLVVAVQSDLNNDVAELNEGNNAYNITYRVDMPLLANQTSVQLNPGNTHDMNGGTNDLEWDGANLVALSGGEIGKLQGATYEFVHYDMLAPGLQAYDPANCICPVQTTGQIFAMATAEGRRAVIRVDNLQAGGPIWISYRVYNDTP